MHFILMEHLERKDDLKKPQMGIVVENVDPKKRMRVKVKIKGLLEENNTEKLPWVYCRMATSTPGGKAIYVPRKNSRLVIEFDQGDINFPCYTGYWSDKSNILTDDEMTGYSPLWKNNYSDVYGWEDEIHNYEIHDLIDKFTEYGYTGGYKRRIDKDNNLTDKQLKTLLMQISDKAHIDCNNILMGAGTTGHNALLVEAHLTKFNTLIDSITSAIITPMAAATDPVSAVAALQAVVVAWNGVQSSLKDLTNKTAQLKAK